MKILFVSGSYPTKASHPMKLSLEDLGAQVEEVHRWKREVSHYQDDRSLMEKIFEKLKMPLDKDGANQNILSKIESSSYDVIFIVKGNHIFPSTLSTIKKNYPHVKLINWSLDDMFAKHNRSYFYTLNLKKYDLVVSTKSYNLDKYELPSLGAKKILFQNNSSYQFDYMKTIKRNENYKYEVCFIGTAEKQRFKSMNYLARNGIKVTIFGSGWEKKQYSDFHPNLTINCQNLEGRDYFKAIASSKISLCFLRKINRDRQTLRTVEIPSVGGFMLAEYSEEHASMFEDFHEASFFRTDNELLQKVNFYLQDDLLRENIAKKGKERAKSYNMIQSAEKILEELYSEG
tara:strand:+ start:5001 stop:6035 length:1035 start_codon:yes stop_codon:yes gene_type:complete